MINISRGIIRIEASGRILSLDADGRMMYYNDGYYTYRRTLMNDVIRMKANKFKILNEREKIDVINEFYDILNNTNEGYLPRIEDGYSFLVNESKKLFNIYNGKIPVVPPDRYHSLYIRITNGCPWNRCTFCSLYKDVKYGFNKYLCDQIKALKDYFKNSMESRTGIFLGDANAIGINKNILFKDIKIIKEHFDMPFYAFSDSFTSPLNTGYGDLINLKNHGFKMIYIGLESASRYVLKFFNKNLSIETTKRYINMIKESGINLGIIIMDIKGDLYKSHVRETSRFIKSLNLDKDDILYISRLIPGFELREYAYYNDVSLTGSNESIEKFIETDARISRYNIREALY
ncbi:radical SAM protein [Picrophilus oshimae]|uniref:Radical SAM core domain-containing protein n=1 Tax=Picrophilus torridus (strain ATCC 700027 / DSM 9790 / JCM 10055 / NBRC 100828 / KAW 2/3) TaxID=1122961 RepID=A0A8G2L7A5_PICTO|nr:radical SAM protein [Picrophilus oshimae]SMD30868.1 hypothetical protein SAMN02745355_0784 [Picrophilus oshimae DSM 9789]